MSTIEAKDIHRGDIWIVDLNPTVGAEQSKRRPVVVISSDLVGILPIKLAAPITEWKDRYTKSIWFTKVEPSPKNGLDKTGGIDALQVRSLDAVRFKRRLGRLEDVVLEEVVSALAIITEYTRHP